MQIEYSAARILWSHQHSQTNNFWNEFSIIRTMAQLRKKKFKNTLENQSLRWRLISVKWVIKLRWNCSASIVWKQKHFLKKWEIKDKQNDSKYLPFVGGGIEAFHVKYGGDSIEAADSKHHLIYHLEKMGGVGCNRDLKQVDVYLK